MIIIILLHMTLHWSSSGRLSSMAQALPSLRNIFLFVYYINLEKLSLTLFCFNN